MDLDDPKITAYALGELSDREREAIEQELANSPEARALVAETRQLAADLKQAFRAELDSTDPEPRNVLPLPYARLFWSERRWPGVAIAAVLVASLSIAALVLWRSSARWTAHYVSSRTSAGPDSETVTVEYYGTDDQRMAADSFPAGEEERPFVAVSAQPLSIFRTRVGTSSYSAVSMFIESGVRPPKGAVRIEEMINHFRYNYRDPAGDNVAMLTIDVASCPWASGHELVRIAAKFRDDSQAGDLSDTIENLISASEIEVQFNPDRVQSYRLLGYDAPAAERRDATPTGSVARRESKRAVTAFYEISPVKSAPPAGTTSKLNEVALVARIRSLGSPPKIVTEESLRGVAVPFEKASSDFRFAATVAEFGMILRESAYKGSGTLSDVVNWAQSSASEDSDDERSSFVECARKAQSLL